MALPFGIDGDENAVRYGQFYWAINLNVLTGESVCIDSLENPK